MRIGQVWFESLLDHEHGKLTDPTEDPQTYETWILRFILFFFVLFFENTAILYFFIVFYFKNLFILIGD